MKKEKIRYTKIILDEPAVYFDDEKQRFKLLQNFLNCYKDKMNLSTKTETSDDLLNTERIRAIKEGIKVNEDQIDMKIDFKQFSHFQQIDIGKGRNKSDILNDLF